MLTPDTAAAFTYPPELARDLHALPGGYQIDVDVSEADRLNFLRQTERCAQQRIKAIHHLSRTHDWDVLVAVFTEPDRLQHFFWADMDVDHPLHPADAYPDALLSLYRQIDTGLAQLLSDLDDDTLVLLVSDHGFNACARKFYVNTWLQQAGFLAWRSSAAKMKVLENWFWRLRRIEALRTLKRSVPGLRQRAVVRALRQQVFAKSIDWTATRAFFSEELGIRINLRGREPLGIVALGDEYDRLCESLREQLSRLVDPVTNSPVIEAVYKREELYSGPYVELAPDLIVEPYRDNLRPEYNTLLGSVSAETPPQAFGFSSPYTANHTMSGILIAHGRMVQRDVPLAQANIIDIAPTLLAYLGVPVPTGLDGRILTELFIPEVAAQLTGVPVDFKAAGVAANDLVYTADEEAEVLQRLKDLGYLG